MKQQERPKNRPEAVLRAQLIRASALVNRRSLGSHEGVKPWFSNPILLTPNVKETEENT